MGRSHNNGTGTFYGSAMALILLDGIVNDTYSPAGMHAIHDYIVAELIATSIHPRATVVWSTIR
jgi:hypothetical protein